MNKKYNILLMCCLIILLTACGPADELHPVTESEAEEMTTFITQYREDLATAFNHFNFSLVEDYFVPNSHYYHFQRKQIQQNRAQRIEEEIVDINVQTVKQDQHGDYHVFTLETIHTIDPRLGASTEEIEQFYIVMIFRDEPRVLDRFTVNSN